MYKKHTKTKFIISFVLAMTFVLSNFVIQAGATVDTLKLGKVTDSSVTLTWSKVPSAKKIFVQQQINGEFVDISSDLGTSLSHTVTGLDEKSNYKFRLRIAYQNSSNTSNPVSASTKYTDYIKSAFFNFELNNNKKSVLSYTFNEDTGEYSLNLSSIPLNYKLSTIVFVAKHVVSNIGVEGKNSTMMVPTAVGYDGIQYTVTIPDSFKTMADIHGIELQKFKDLYGNDATINVTMQCGPKTVDTKVHVTFQ